MRAVSFVVVRVCFAAEQIVRRFLGKFMAEQRQTSRKGDRNQRETRRHEGDAPCVELIVGRYVLARYKRKETRRRKGPRCWDANALLRDNSRVNITGFPMLLGSGREVRKSFFGVYDQ